VAIGLLERFVCDQNTGKVVLPPLQDGQAAKTAAKRVAAVGSGPASLALAQHLAVRGHAVTVFERSQELGGVLSWIPKFKLSPEVLKDHLDSLREMGVTFYTNTEVRWIEELLHQGFDAVFLGIGASRASVPQMPGVNLDGVLSSTEFLVRVFYSESDLPQEWESIRDLIGKRVAVLGGGDSAMDCVRTALRLKAAEVTCIYRRDEANMPGSKKEVKAAKEEGAQMLYLSAPAAFTSDDSVQLSGVSCVRMQLGEPDASGRRSAKPVAGSAFQVKADLAILAFGYEVDPAIDDEHLYLLAPPKGTVRVNPQTGATPLKGVLAGGDCVTGPALVSNAVQAGLAAAQGMLRYFAGEQWEKLTG
jgi:glutamate synthase (NADPH/NADH) small chain